MRSQRHTKYRPLRPYAVRAFSLVELVIVVTIIGILSSIAIPRLSGAAHSANQAALQATLTGVRTAIDIYYAEHGKYPGYTPSNGLPDGGWFVNQLTMYSNAQGDVAAAPSAVYRFGPYLRKPFPTNPANKLSTVYVKPDPTTADPSPSSVGWVAVLSHGYFGISASSADLKSVGIDAIISKIDLGGGAILAN